MKYDIGSIIKCQVTGIEKYGIFVKVDDKFSGLIHISEISPGFVRNIEDYVLVGNMIYAKVLEVDEENLKIKLSIKGLDYKHNKNHPGTLEQGEGFLPLKKHLNIWIDEKLEEIKKNNTKLK